MGGVLLTAGVTTAAWNPPTGNPPNNNTAAPINVSGDSQSKLGSLILQNGLGLSGGNLQVSSGWVLASGDVSGSRLCIAGTCKSSWPTGVSGGTTNYLPYWSSATSLSSTGLYYDVPNGRIGIGVTTPNAAIHIVDRSNGITIGGNGTSNGIFAYATNIGIESNSPSGFDFFGNGSKSYFTKVGIGTTSPVTTLDVRSSGSAITGVSSNSGTSGVYGQADGSNSYGVYGYSNGSIGVMGQGSASGVSGYSWNGIGVDGLSSASAGVGISGKATVGESVGVKAEGRYGVLANGYRDGVKAASSDSSGNDFYAFGAGKDYGSASSIRWKHNIQPIDNALNKVLNLRGVYFDWNADYGGGHDIGMIAEEVGVQVPEVVGYESNGKDAESIDYGRLTSILVEAIKDQQREIVELKAKVEELSKKN